MRQRRYTCLCISLWANKHLIQARLFASTQEDGWCRNSVQSAETVYFISLNNVQILKVSQSAAAFRFIFLPQFYIFMFVSQDAEEYSELPVRHNEDQLNSQLAQQLPLQVNPHSFDSAHTKTHLLLQAHFSQAQLPCSDYTTDTKTVLDNAIRICQVRRRVQL